MPSYRPVNAVLRGLEVLRATSELEGQANVGEIHRQTGMDKATIVRMLETLGFAGYVVRNDDGPSYQITGKTLRLSVGYDQHQAVGAIVAPILADFRASVGWPSDVAVFDHDAMVVVETSREPGPLFLNRLPGYRGPALGSSLGLAYMAHCTEEERTAVLERIVDDPAPWNDAARESGRALAILEKVREQGFSTMNHSYREQEYDNKVSSIGVPIAAQGRVYASMNVLFLLNVLSEKKAVQTLLQPLEQAAAHMAAELAERWED